MIKAVIIDDEPKSVFTLHSFLRVHCPQVQVAGSASDAVSGKALIEREGPQLVFLDIEMPMGSGFDLLRSIGQVNFEIIFITAYNQYAINAFRYAAIDYLLKPLRITQLVEAVHKAEARINTKAVIKDYELLLRNVHEQNGGKQRILLTDKGEQQPVQVDTIMYCIASANYTHIQTADRSFLSSRNLKEFEEMLPADSFCRIHYSHIININFIDKMLKGRGGTVLMQDGKELEIAVRRKEEFMSRFK